MGDDKHGKDDPDRAAILARRNRFIAVALSGLTTALSGCDDKDSTGPEPCLKKAPPSTGTPEPCLSTDPGDEAYDDAGEDEGAPPEPCLNVAPPEPCLEVAPPPDPDPKPEACLKVAPPQPCLDVAPEPAPAPAPKPKPQPQPQPCLKVKPPKK